MSRTSSYILCLLLLAVSPCQGQEDLQLRQSFSQAEEDYKIGRLDQCIDVLKSNVSSYRGTLLQNAYRMLALCYLAKDDEALTDYYARLLLQVNPYYTSVSDPARFEQLIGRLKQGRGYTITTASNQAENLSEVPVPTTLITEEMIRNSGASNLQEVLAAYVPSMHIIDSNTDINIAMRGIYSNSQEKILVMINGHRLNSYCTNTASPDFSISLEKIKQIEVLRGPASSLYGGVALTAVVNLITKQGVDVDGVVAKAAVGNNGQLRGDLMLGKHYFDFDLLTWGSIYRASGEKGSVPSDQLSDDFNLNSVDVGCVGSKPTHDFGLQLRWRGLQFFYNTRFSQIVQPLTMSTLARPYYHDRYRTYNGIFPSYAIRSHHADLSYQLPITRKFSIDAKITYDNSDLTHYQVISETALPDFFSLFSAEQYFSSGADNVETINASGLSRYINGQEQTYGGQLKGDYHYVNSARHKGSLTFGVEYSHFELDDVRYVLGYDYNKTFTESSKITDLGLGHENYYNAFLQLKHQWGPIIFNAGLRYDHKVRTESNINEFSPRAALIFLQPKWNLKFSYSKAFVDAPYLYRKTNSFLYSINGIDPSLNTLNSESLHSFQLTFASLGWVPGLNVELNAFYNAAHDMIVTKIIEYTNQGTNKTLGLELMANYQWRRFTANLNVSRIHTIGLSFSERDIDSNNNTPGIMGNLVLGWKPTDRLNLYSHLSYTGSQTTYNSDVAQLINAMKYVKKVAQFTPADEEYFYWLSKVNEAYDHSIYEADIDARFLVNIGANYTLRHLTFGIDVHNLFNTKGYLSGMNTKLVPQKGRWWTVSLAYKF